MVSVRGRHVRPRWARHECPGSTRHPQWLSSLHQIYLRSGRKWFTSILGRSSRSIHFAGCLHHHDLSEANIHRSHDQLVFIRSIFLQEGKRGEYDSTSPVCLFNLRLARRRVEPDSALLPLEWLSAWLRWHTHRHRFDEVPKQKQQRKVKLTRGRMWETTVVRRSSIHRRTYRSNEKEDPTFNRINSSWPRRSIRRQTTKDRADILPNQGSRTETSTIKHSVTYAATCKECGDTYVGMTKRQTVTRLCEYGAPKDTFDRETNNNVDRAQPITVQQQTRSSRNTTTKTKAKQQQQDPPLRRSSRIRDRTVALATPVTNTNDVRQSDHRTKARERTKNAANSWSVAEHEESTGHRMDWKIFRALWRDNNVYRLLIKESLVIRAYEPRLNRTTHSVPLVVFSEGLERHLVLDLNGWPFPCSCRHHPAEREDYSSPADHALLFWSINSPPSLLLLCQR